MDNKPIFTLEQKAIGEAIAIRQFALQGIQIQPVLSEHLPPHLRGLETLESLLQALNSARHSEPNHANRTNTRYVQFMRFWAITNRIIDDKGLPHITFAEARDRFEEMRSIHIEE